MNQYWVSNDGTGKIKAFLDTCLYEDWKNAQTRAEEKFGYSIFSRIEELTEAQRQELRDAFLVHVDAGKISEINEC